MSSAKVSHRTTSQVNPGSPSNAGWTAIPRSRVYSLVAKQLQDRIINKLKPGDMLPPERELVRRFRVSRSSIRDAIRSLETLGLLEPRQGVGTIVRDASAEALAAPMASAILQKQKAIRELLDARRIIEPALARRAALHASLEQIAALRNIVRRQEEKVARGELATDEDTTFHHTVALAADNSTMMKLVQVLMDLLRETRERSLQGEGRPQKSLAGHRRILAALESRDPDAAEAAVHKHLSEIEQVVLQKL
jgi:GntR family transcriptional repressor for pyruvate dehydrogenase complex